MANDLPKRLLVVLALGGTITIAPLLHVQTSQFLAGGVDFGTKVRLVGASLNHATDASDAVDVTLEWEDLAPPPADCVVHLRLIDQSGGVAARRDKTPLFGLRPCSTWQPGEVIEDEEFVRLPPGADAGSYQLVIGLSFGGSTASPEPGAPTVTWHDAEQPNDVIWQGLRLGVVGVGPTPDVSARNQTTTTIASLDGRIALTSADVQDVTAPRPNAPGTSDARFVAVASPGDRLAVDLGWQATLDVSEDYSVFNHLLDTNQKLVAQDDAWPDRFNFPTSVWFPGDRRLDHYEIAIPSTLNPGIYFLVAGMYERKNFSRLPVQGGAPGQDQIDLGRVKLRRPDQIFGTLVPVDRRNDDFGGQIALIGSRLRAATPRPGGVLSLDVAWQALAQPRADYTVFVHILDPAGKVAAQHDGPPISGTYPTSAWDAGDTIYDRVDVPLPAALLPGRYQIEIGLYRLATGARLNLPDGQSAASLGSITLS